MRWPALSLSTRLTLTLVFLVVVAQAVSLVGFARLGGAGGGWRLPVPVRIAAAADALDRTPSARRDDLLVAMNGDATRFFLTRETPDGYHERDGVVPRLFDGYGAALQGRNVRLLVRNDRRRLIRDQEDTRYAFSVALADGQRLIVAPGLQQRRRGIAVAMLVLNLTTALIAALLVWRTVRAATRRLEGIASASNRFAVDLDAPPMDETGSVEARQVAAAFNHMRGEIRRLMAERMRMLAAVAHDLKTLLTRLRLRVALIEDDDQRARGDRDIALAAALIEDVLMVARGEEKRVVMTSVDIGVILKDVMRERMALGQPVTLGRVDSGPASAEPATLRRIVENLVENAVAYAGSARGEFERGPDGWALRIVDRGPGLSQEFAAHAFEPFARGEASRSRDTGGSGLGLSIARTLARQMGADLTLEATPGGGVTALLTGPGGARAPGD